MIFQKEFYALSCLFGIGVFYVSIILFDMQSLSQFLTFGTTSIFLITIIQFGWVTKLKKHLAGSNNKYFKIILNQFTEIILQNITLKNII